MCSVVEWCNVTGDIQSSASVDLPGSAFRSRDFSPIVAVKLQVLFTMFPGDSAGSPG